MKPFTYVRADSITSAVNTMATTPGAKFLGGGTNLVDLIRAGVEHPNTLIDITHLPLTGIAELPTGAVRIGALAKNSHAAAHPLIRTRYPVVTQAILAGASGQLRNMATVGGNLLQRTRCHYFYDTATPCNKRTPGEGCAALNGYNRNHAVLGTSDHCIATHPSDMCVALTALDAVVETEGPTGKRRIPVRDFHQPPGDTPDVETALRPGELITAVELPPLPAAKNSRYRKVRDRASYAFALVSTAVALTVEDGRVGDVHIALGGVATHPWRAQTAETALKGAPATEATFREAAEAELSTAITRPDNDFKVPLAIRTLTATLAGLV
ncbi:FAD binding domain-containing protein [Actinophytocola glycyrrhizae]|uniref:FAD binding domain-containing protein n=1 Tax=Actinophytocola glycyrrhizae TaxID=2044873 RepID=A0ABV9SCC5_9PSEU